MTDTAETAALQLVRNRFLGQENGRLIEMVLMRESFETIYDFLYLCPEDIDDLEYLNSKVTLTLLHRRNKGLICAMKVFYNHLNDLKPISSESDWQKIKMAESDELRISKAYCSSITQLNQGARFTVCFL